MDEISFYSGDDRCAAWHFAATRLCRHSGGRVTSTPTAQGWYDYQIGYDAEDHSSYTVVREDRLDDLASISYPLFVLAPLGVGFAAVASESPKRAPVAPTPVVLTDEDLERLPYGGPHKGM